MAHIHHPTGDIYDNDFTTQSTSETVNHIHLHQEAILSEFDTWTRQIGTLLQVASTHASLKPVLDLLVSTIEPERIFLTSYPAIKKYRIKSCVDILLIIDESKMDMANVKPFVKMVGLKMQDIIITIRSKKEMEDGLANNRFYYVSNCQEAFLIFSGSPYRLSPTSFEYLNVLASVANEVFKAGMTICKELMKIAKAHLNAKQYLLALMMLRLTIEQVYRTILKAFDEKAPLFYQLRELQSKASEYLPQVQPVLIGQNILHVLDTASALQTNLIIDNHDDVVQNLYAMVENMINVSTKAFENKLLIQTRGRPEEPQNTGEVLTE